MKDKNRFHRKHRCYSNFSFVGHPFNNNPDVIFQSLFDEIINLLGNCEKVEILNRLTRALKIADAYISKEDLLTLPLEALLGKFSSQSIRIQELMLISVWSECIKAIPQNCFEYLKKMIDLIHAKYSAMRPIAINAFTYFPMSGHAHFDLLFLFIYKTYPFSSDQERVFVTQYINQHLRIKSVLDRELQWLLQAIDFLSLPSEKEILYKRILYLQIEPEHSEMALQRLYRSETEMLAALDKEIMKLYIWHPEIYFSTDITDSTNAKKENEEATGQIIVTHISFEPDDYGAQLRNKSY